MCITNIIKPKLSVSKSGKLFFNEIKRSYVDYSFPVLKPFGIAVFSASPLSEESHIADYYGNSSVADLQQIRQSLNLGQKS